VQKKIGLILVPLAFAVLAIALLGGRSTQARETAPPLASEPQVQQVEGYYVFECFQVLASWGEGAYPLRTVELETDNFYEDEVVVLRLAMMCETAVKYPQGDDGEPVAEYSVFACYQIIRGQYVGEPLTLNTDNFGDDYVFASLSNMMCESASKYHDGEVGGGEPEDSTIWQCFKLSGLPQLDKFSIRTDNFGYHDILVLAASQLCEDATKYDDGYTYGDIEDPLVQECFYVTRLGFSLGFEKVTLYTENFGEVHALVGRPVMMCERAYKYHESNPG
jgi:hypothetical protein